jgi:hypothetical protein
MDLADISLGDGHALCLRRRGGDLMDLVVGRLDVPVARTQAQRKQWKDEGTDESGFHVHSFVDVSTYEDLFATLITRYRFLISYFYMRESLEP